MEFRYQPPAYSRESGVRIEDYGDGKITVRFQYNCAEILANRDGLISLAQHLLSLAQSEVPPGCHIHYIPGLSLEEDSVPLVIARTPD